MFQEARLWIWTAGPIAAKVPPKTPHENRLRQAYLMRGVEPLARVWGVSERSILEVAGDWR